MTKPRSIRIQFYVLVPLIFAGFTALAAQLTYHLMRSGAVAAGRTWPLLATAGFPQQRPRGYAEPPLVTMGADLTSVETLMAGSPGRAYSADDVVNFVLAGARQVAEAS